MRTIAFMTRNTKEILRDKLNLIFGLGFPIIILILLNLIQRNVPVELFEISYLTPGVAVFGLSFISLFAGLLVAKDRTSSFMLRLFTSPMKSSDFILGYFIPLLPIALAQIIITFIFAIFLKLPISFKIITTILLNIPTIALFAGIGILCGSLMNEKQVGGFCGALLTNLSAWLSGVWFDTALLGNTFEKIANILPFAHAVKIGRLAIIGDYSQLVPHLIIVTLYSVVIIIIAIKVFTYKMKSN